MARPGLGRYPGVGNSPGAIVPSFQHSTSMVQLFSGLLRGQKIMLHRVCYCQWILFQLLAISLSKDAKLVATAAEIQ